MSYPKTPPEDQIPKGCSLHSMEPLREWFCKGADMTSAAEYEAALVQLDSKKKIHQISGIIMRTFGKSGGPTSHWKA